MQDLHINDSSEWIDAEYQVTPRERNWIEKQIFEVSRQKAVAQLKFKTVQLGRGCKQWYVYTDVEPEEPVADDDFLTESQHEQRKSEDIYYPQYRHYDYKIAMVNSDAVKSARIHKMGLPQQTIRNLSGGIADYREKIIWRGYDISGRDNAAANRQGDIDSNTKGILNTVGINTFHAG
ncbi:unnamed protein product, partial [marine sediment metagenome]